jgi:hypothetical protein
MDKGAAAIDAQKEAEMAAQSQRIRELEVQLHCAKAIYCGGRGWQQRSSQPAHRRHSEHACMQELLAGGQTLAAVHVPKVVSQIVGGTNLAYLGSWVYSVSLLETGRFIVRAYNFTTGALQVLFCAKQGQPAPECGCTMVCVNGTMVCYGCIGSSKIVLERMFQAQKPLPCKLLPYRDLDS